MGVATNETLTLGRRQKKNGYLFLLVQTDGGVVGRLVRGTVDHGLKTPVERRSTNRTSSPARQHGKKNVWLMRLCLPYMVGLELIFHVRKALRFNRMSAKSFTS